MAAIDVIPAPVSPAFRSSTGILSRWPTSHVSYFRSCQCHFEHSFIINRWIDASATLTYSCSRVPYSCGGHPTCQRLKTNWRPGKFASPPRVKMSLIRRWCKYTWRPPCQKWSGCLNYLTRFATRSSSAKSPTLRCSLIESPETVPVYLIAMVCPLKSKVSSKEI